jgi:hypothetical protein
MSQFKTTTIEDTEMIYSLLKDKYPDRQIEIEFNDNTKEYFLKLTNGEFKEDPEVPVDIKIKIIYGDSVTGDTPVLLKKNDNIYIETIQSIFDESEKFEYPGFKMFDKTIRLEKEYCLSDYQIWSDIGWVDIKKVIRHKCEKKIYRVLTHTGCIDVTEDHSLLTENKEPIKPVDLKIGDSLLHSFPKEFIENEVCIVKMEKNITNTKVCNTCKIEKDVDEFYKNNKMKSGRMNKCRDCDYYKDSSHPLRNIYKNFKLEDYPLTEKEAEVWGFFQGDGSCGSYNCKSGIKNSWALNNNDLKRLNYFKDILESVEPIKFKILDTLKSSGVYKLVPTGSLKYMVDKYRKLFYYQQDCNGEGDKYKIVPNCILNASKEIKMAYWKGYYEADGAKTNGYSTECPSFAVKGKIGAQCMYYLMKSIGYNMYINLDNHHPKKQEIYFLNVIRNVRKDSTLVKKIVDKGNPDDYVYDLETNIGRFGAGVGKLQLKNTDSVFLSLKYNRQDFNKNRSDSFNLATICGDNLTDQVFKRPPVEMEFEKVFQPFILLTKKRYIGKKYENMKDPFKLKEITKSGIAVSRRDFSKIVKNCYTEVIDCIVNEDGGGVNDSVEIYKSYVDRIDNYQIDIDDLITSKTLAKNYSCALCKKKTEWIHLKCDSCNKESPLGSLKCIKCKAIFKCIHKFNLVHVQLAIKMLNRKDEANINDRIQFVFIESDDRTLAKNELGEDPVYVKKNNLKYNRSFYLESLGKTILAFFKVCLNEHYDLLNEAIEYTNDKLESYGNKKLKPSDFKLDDN